MNPFELAQSLKETRARVNARLMGEGVYLLDPEHTYIDEDVTIGRGTVIHPNCTMTGGTQIGEDCEILSNCRLHASKVGDGTRVESSVLLEASVGAGANIGPFAYLRPGAVIGDGCRIGDFVEIKNSSIGEHTHISHLTYVGDSDVGARVNLGCGVVFVNYDGKVKHRSAVGDDAFIGCNVNLVSPVHIGEAAYVAAGSTITEDVPSGAFAIARERETIKPGWVETRRREGKL